MNLTDIKEKNEDIEKIYNLIKEGEETAKTERGRAINLLGEAWKRYENIIDQKGKPYCKNNCPDMPIKLRGLVDLLDYNS